MDLKPSTLSRLQWRRLAPTPSLVQIFWLTLLATRWESPGDQAGKYTVDGGTGWSLTLSRSRKTCLPPRPRFPSSLPHSHRRGSLRNRWSTYLVPTRTHSPAFNSPKHIDLYWDPLRTHFWIRKNAGSHTLGVTHCVHLRDRIFTPIDPTMPKSLLKQLQRVCPKITSPTPLVIDRLTPHKFDTQYYQNIASGQGLMTSDQDLFNDDSTRRFVVKNLKHGNFIHRFGKAMIAMTNIEPTIAPDGEIRRRCQFLN